MNLDEKITKVLNQESQAVDHLMLEEPGVFGMLKASFKGGMRFWFVFVYIFGFLAFLAFIWAGYQFWYAIDIKDAIFWGVLLVVVLQVQTSLKMWSFMEMNRISVMREVKRIEIQLATMNKTNNDF
jgi:hypothetical protein